MYTTYPLICWCSSMFSLLWCKILLHYNEYSPFRRSNTYHTWNISYRTISTISFLVKIGTCLGLNSLVLTVKTHQPCFRLFARGVFLSVISRASLPFFCRHPAILDFCGGYRWQLVPRLPFPVPRFSNIRWWSIKVCKDGAECKYQAHVTYREARDYRSIFIQEKNYKKKSLINIRGWKLSLIGKKTNYVLCVRKLVITFSVERLLHFALKILLHIWGHS